MTRRDVGIALSLANLFYIRLWAELFCAGIPAQAYFINVANVDFVAAAVNVLLLGGLFLGATVAARRFGGRYGRPLVISGFVAVILLHASGAGPEVEPGVLALIEWRRRGYWLQPLAPLVGLAAVAAVCARWPKQALELSTGAVFAFFPFVLVTFARAAWTLATVNPGSALAAKVPGIGAPLESVEGPRVVVIVFDGLARRLAFEQRPAGLALPAFDRLRSESIDATQVAQPGPKTRISLPVLVSGIPVLDSSPADGGDLMLTIGETAAPRKERWSALPNLFRSARDLGGVAVVAGWYHPYCRIFPELSACSWYPSRTVGGHGQDGTGFLETLRDQQQSLLPYVNLRLRQVDIFQRQRADARIAVVQGGKGLVFLHLMVPHKPWIWNREAEELTVRRFGIDLEGYFDNVALADRLLGELRQEMEAAGKWKDTAVVITSDHVLRRPAHHKDPKDLRVPFLVKMPGQETGIVYERPFNAMAAHDLTQALLRGELSTPEAAVEWLDARGGLLATPEPGP